MVSKEEFDSFKETLFSDNDKTTHNKSIKKIRAIKYTLFAVEVLIAVLILALCLPERIRTGGDIIFQLMPVLMFLLFALVLTNVITKILEKKKLEEFRKEKVPRLMQYLIGEQLNLYAIDNFLPENDFKSAGFAGSYDFYKGEDFVSIDIPKDNGQRSGVAFNACDLRVTKEVKDSDGDSHTVTVYSGAFCAVEFPFQFKCSLAINSSLSGVKKFKLEDVQFNKTFQVFTDNQVEALCILTPSTMQKLSKLNEITKKVKMSFVGNHLYIGFPNLNLFELNVGNSGINGNSFDRVYDNVKLLLAIIDEIKANNKVFKI